MQVKFRIHGEETIQARILKFLNAKAFEAIMDKAVKDGFDRSFDLCPVDTGYMQSCLHATKLGQGYYKFGVTGCPYAIYNEYGCANIPTIGTPEQPEHYKGGYRPFIRPGIIRIKESLHLYIKNWIIE
jgi:hypothetical protein